MIKQPTLIRYWGSFFKSPRAVGMIAKDLRPAAEIGWSTLLVCCNPPEDESWLKRLREIGTKIIYHSRARGNFDYQCILRVYRLCRLTNADILHCDNNHTSPLIGAFLAGVGSRVWTKRAMEPICETNRKATFRDKVAISLRLSCYLSKRVLAVSNAVRTELIQHGINSEKVVVINNAIDKTSVINGDRGKSRSELGYKDYELVITSIGHAVPVKGWDILIKAFAEIADGAPNAKLLLVGSISGEHEKAFSNELMRIINDRKLKNRVKFVGHVPDIRGMLAASDVFVLPSRSEGFGIALAEGLAAGLPCISSNVGIAPELIENGINGYLFCRDDFKELSKNLFLAISDDNHLKRLKDGAKASNSKILGIEEYGDKLLNIYKVILGEKRYPI